MRSDVPEVVASALARAVIRARQPAFVTSDGEGNVMRWGGPLDSYGIGELRAGRPIDSQIPFLTGLLPLAETPAEWFRMQTDGVFADVHLVPHGAEDWVILLDSTHEVRGELSAQQMRNELVLERERNGAEVSDFPVGLGEYFSSLDQLALVRRPDGAFSPISVIPAWACELFSLSAAVDVIRPYELSPFLENFLLEADSHWSERSAGALRSGAWQEFDRNGVTFHLEASAVAVPGLSLLVIERLGSQHQHAAETLQKAREARLGHYELLRELEEKEVLLHTIVHDLSGPATAMQGFLQLVTGTALPENLERLAAVAMRQAQRQQEMIAEILDVFAAERRDLQEFHFDAAKAPDVIACAREAVQSLAPVYAKRKVQLRMDPSWGGTDSLPVVGEKSRLDRVLFNLLENALRYSRRGGTVAVTIQVEDGGVRVMIDDEGEGIDPETAEKLFEKFSQGRDDKKGKAGLGLYFCRLTIERWGGAIGCEPRSRGGSRFWFRLTLAKPET